MNGICSRSFLFFLDFDLLDAFDEGLLFPDAEPIYAPNGFLKTLFQHQDVLIVDAVISVFVHDSFDDRQS